MKACIERISTHTNSRDKKSEESLRTTAKRVVMKIGHTTYTRTGISAKKKITSFFFFFSFFRVSIVSHVRSISAILCQHASRRCGTKWRRRESKVFWFKSGGRSHRGDKSSDRALACLKRRTCYLRNCLLPSQVGLLPVQPHVWLKSWRATPVGGREFVVSPA